MPIISMFYGIIVMMYYFDNRKHHLPHIHIKYQGKEAVFSLENGAVLDGEVPNKQRKLVEAWIEIHKEELVANWELAVNGEKIFSIDPLK